MIQAVLFSDLTNGAASWLSKKSRAGRTAGLLRSSASRWLPLSAWLCVAGLLTGCAERRDAAPKAQLFEGLGTHGRAVTTGSPEAQRYFDQGLVWAFAFNHDEAIRSFEKAAELDPQCAMAWWGVALCHGPHINFPMMTPEQSQAAWAALERAKATASNASPSERALIDALSKRYAQNPPDNRRPLDEAYAQAMEDVWRAHPKDADIAVLYAESLMDLQPWDLWTPDGQPKGRTTDVLAVLEEALRLQPDHPGANHLYIHALENSPTPERAIAAADRLRNSVPASGHLVHMPAHIDVQVGEWAKASDQNVKAAAADARYYKLSPRQGFYRVYMLHNHHFLAFSSMMEGCSETAMEAARETVSSVPASFRTEHPEWIDPYLMIPYDVMLRFGRWDEMLREPAPPKELMITTAMWHFARGVSHAALGQVDKAEDELAELRRRIALAPEERMMAINPARKVLSIAENTLAGEIEYRRGNIDAAVRLLETAVQTEDSLLYIEPPDWTRPVRHALGAILLDAGRAAEAEAVYRADLRAWPENGWSLYGLAESLRAQGKTAELEDVDQRFARTWARADVKIGSSCLCVPGNAARADVGQRRAQAPRERCAMRGA